MVYIVDDEPNVRQLAAVALQDAGFATRTFAGGAPFLAAVAEQLPDAVVLDWMMPEPDGMAVCRRLRADARTRPLPVLMLTARADEVDRVVGLEMGADDYIIKPFSLKELAARVRAVLRRGEYLKEQEEPPMACGDLEVDLARRMVTKRGRQVALTAKEFDLLAALMRNRGRVMTRDMLLDSVWGADFFGDARTVDVHVRYLRQKIEDTPEAPRYIQTMRGVGYRFAQRVDAP
nr:response regulator transcription factor [Maliibacterium massiliense]